MKRQHLIYLLALGFVAACGAGNSSSMLTNGGNNTFGSSQLSSSSSPFSTTSSTLGTSGTLNSSGTLGGNLNQTSLGYGSTSSPYGTMGACSSQSQAWVQMGESCSPQDQSYLMQVLPSSCTQTLMSVHPSDCQNFPNEYQMAYQACGGYMQYLQQMVSQGLSQQCAVALSQIL